MRFLVPVVPGNRLEIEVQVLKFIEGFALVEAVATVDGTPVAKGKLGFARRGLQAQNPA
jgi:3-hydroxymyristoyl/3-hydroxydecanoyl-(acyl carrier protein) dehydratase